MERGDISVLPEDCITKILLFTSPYPRDASNSSTVSSAFRSAADSDLIWEKFLPSDYKDIVSKSATPIDLSDYSSKKALYYRLCDDPILIDGGTKCFYLEKKSGKKCFMIGAKALGIDWGDTPQYWKWISLPDSRFAETAELLRVWWLLIRGRLETRILSPKTRYVAYLVIKFCENASGLNYPPTRVSVKFLQGRGDTSGSRTIYLDPNCSWKSRGQYRPQQLGLIRRSSPHILMPPRPSDTICEGQFPSERGDGWMEIEMGEFYNDQGEDGEVEMILKQTTGWKHGLIVQGIEVRPKATST